MTKSIEKQIEEYKVKLNSLIEENASYDEIYEVSKKIDILINLYLDEKQQQ